MKVFCLFPYSWELFKVSGASEFGDNEQCGVGMIVFQLNRYCLRTRSLKLTDVTDKSRIVSGWSCSDVKFTRIFYTAKQKDGVSRRE